MVQVLRAADRNWNGRRTFKFEGRSCGAEISFFAVDNAPGEGPGLHVHPYAETWIVKSGAVRLTAGNESLNAGRNDVVVIPPDTPHKFVNLGPGRLEMVCIHASGVIVQVDLE